MKLTHLPVLGNLSCVTQPGLSTLVSEGIRRPAGLEAERMHLEGRFLRRGGVLRGS